MPFIIWTDGYDSGIHEVDIQHRKLVGYINTLFENINQKDKKLILNQTFKELINYSLYHFKLEEELMSKYKYPEYYSHKKEHQLFVEKINKFTAQLQNNEGNVMLTLINFLKDWLLNHIIGPDKMYASYILTVQ